VNVVDPLGLWGWNPISDVTQAATDVGHHWRGIAQAAIVVGAAVGTGLCVAATDGLCLAATPFIGGLVGAATYSVSGGQHTAGGYAQAFGEGAWSVRWHWCAPRVGAELPLLQSASTWLLAQVRVSTIIRRVPGATASAGTWRLVESAPSRMHPSPSTSCSMEVTELGDRPADSESVNGSWLEVVNNYRWVGDPRLGKFKVYVDGKTVGSAPLSGSLRVPINPGHHCEGATLVVFESTR